LKFLLEVITLVSSANNTGSDTEYILGGGSFTYATNNRGPKIDPCGTACFNAHQLEKKVLTELGDVTSTLSSLSYTGPEPIFRYSLNSIEM